VEETTLLLLQLPDKWRRQRRRVRGRGGHEHEGDNDGEPVRAAGQGRRPRNNRAARRPQHGFRLGRSAGTEGRLVVADVGVVVGHSASARRPR